MLKIIPIELFDTDDYMQYILYFEKDFVFHCCDSITFGFFLVNNLSDLPA